MVAKKGRGPCDGEKIRGSARTTAGARDYPETDAAVPPTRRKSCGVTLRRRGGISVRGGALAGNPPRPLLCSCRLTPGTQAGTGPGSRLSPEAAAQRARWPRRGGRRQVTSGRRSSASRRYALWGVPLAAVTPGWTAWWRAPSASGIFNLWGSLLMPVLEPTAGLGSPCSQLVRGCGRPALGPGAEGGVPREGSTSGHQSLLSGLVCLADFRKGTGQALDQHTAVTRYCHFRQLVELPK